jgi:hypothetical protein
VIDVAGLKVIKSIQVGRNPGAAIEAQNDGKVLDSFAVPSSWSLRGSVVHAPDPSSVIARPKTEAIWGCRIQALLP